MNLTRIEFWATTIICLTTACVWMGSGSENSAPAEVRIGTFDSRAVALAYYRSPEFNQQMRELHQAHQEAKQEGDAQRVAELEAYGPAQQQRMHKQGFGTWPVDEILEKIKDRIPDIAAQANVNVIVSKWDVVYQKDGLKMVDVTDLLVEPFNPSEETLQVISDVRRKPPVPLEQLEDPHD